MRIYFVRHAAHSLLGRVLCGRAVDVGLNAEGARQAFALAEWSLGERVDLIQCSPQRRARETAEPIAAAFGLVSELAPALDEHDTGEWAGVHFEALARDDRWRAWNERRAMVCPPRGESMRELQSRIVGHIESMRTQRTKGAIMVSHAEPIRAAIMHYRGVALDDFHRVQVEPASIHVLHLNDGSAEICTTSLMAMA